MKGLQKEQGLLVIRRTDGIKLQLDQCLAVIFLSVCPPVACQILKMAKCSVSCDNGSLAVKPKRLTVEPVTKFEVLF